MIHWKGLDVHICNKHQLLRRQLLQNVHAKPFKSRKTFPLDVGRSNGGVLGRLMRYRWFKVHPVVQDLFSYTTSGKLSCRISRLSCHLS